MIPIVIHALWSPKIGFLISPNPKVTRFTNFYNFCFFPRNNVRLVTDQSKTELLIKGNLKLLFLLFPNINHALSVIKILVAALLKTLNKLNQSCASNKIPNRPSRLETLFPFWK